MSIKQLQQGFTIVEMLVVVPIFLIVCIIMVSVLVSKNGELYEKNARINLRLEGLNLLDKVQDELTFANQFNSTLRPELSDPNAPSGGWSYNTNPDTLIISLPAVDKPRKDPSRQFVYYTSGPNDNEIAINNIIYYTTSSNKLYRRVVTPDPSIVSPANFYKKTCPPNDGTACQDDLEMSSHVQSLTAQYFDANNTAVNNNPSIADKIILTLALHDTANGNSIDETVSVTIKKYNDF